jgi:hypothetical protein
VVSVFVPTESTERKGVPTGVLHRRAKRSREAKKEGATRVCVPKLLVCLLVHETLSY